MGVILFSQRLGHLLETGGHKYSRSISQAELSKVLGISRQAISSYLNESTMPTIDKIDAIADFFDVTTDYLIGRTDSMRAENQNMADELGLSDESIDILRTLKREREKYKYHPLNTFMVNIWSPLGSIDRYIKSCPVGAEDPFGMDKLLESLKNGND